MNFARAVRRNDHDGRLFGLDRANFRDRNLEIGEQFEQVRLKLFIAAIKFVDQQHRRLRICRVDGLQERALDQKIRPKNLLEFLSTAGSARFHQPNMQHLARIIPLIHRGADIDPLVALQTDQPGTKHSRQHLRDFGFPYPRLALQQQRLPPLQRQEHRCCQAAVSYIILGKHRPLHIFNSI